MSVQRDGAAALSRVLQHLDATARNQWLAAMAGAIDVLEVAEPERSELISYFASAADHLVNAR